MAAVDGEWDCVLQTPMGEQTAVLTVRSTGGSFTGRMAGSLGGLDVQNGRVEGNDLLWDMELTKPMRLTLHFKATVSGDRIEGSGTAGILGRAPLSGTRRSA